MARSKLGRRDFAKTAAAGATVGLLPGPGPVGASPSTVGKVIGINARSFTSIIEDFIRPSRF